jgi:hypothetical protein
LVDHDAQLRRPGAGHAYRRFGIWVTMVRLELMMRADHPFRVEHSSPVCARVQGVIGRRYDAGVDSIIAVRVRLDSGADRYFLTWGDVGANRCWPGDIERAVLKASVHFALGGTPVDARVCDTLQAASGERYFYECLIAMQQQMPAAARKKFAAWADKMTAAVLRGGELYYLGAPEDQDGRPPAAPGARFGFNLECFDRDGTLVSEYPLDGLTAQDAQQFLGDEDIDRVMCLGRAVSGPALAAITAGRAITIDEAEYKYVLSPWADAGYRTPRGYFPPPG